MIYENHWINQWHISWLINVTSLTNAQYDKNNPNEISVPTPELWYGTWPDSSKGNPHHRSRRLNKHPKRTNFSSQDFPPSGSPWFFGRWNLPEHIQSQRLVSFKRVATSGAHMTNPFLLCPSFLPLPRGPSSSLPMRAQASVLRKLVSHCDSRIC